METIITIFTVLSMYMSASQNVDSKYYYNADIENGIVKTLYVYDKAGDGLTQKMAYHYKYDEQGRLTEKAVCRWNHWDKEYQPSYKLQFTYGDDSYELGRCLWDVANNDWKPCKEKTVYKITNGQLQSVNYFRMNRKGVYNTIDQLRVVESFDGMLLAAMG